jgi:hypothetical protein
MTDERIPDGAPEANPEVLPETSAPATPIDEAVTTSEPTPTMPAYTPPSYTPPPVPPPVTPQPAVAWSAPPAVAAAGKRTTLAVAAGILLLIGGIGGILLGLLIAVVGGTVVSNLNFDQFGYFPDLRGADPGTVAGGVTVFVGIIIAVYSIAYLLAGIGVLRSSNSGRVLGIVVGIISGLIWLGGAKNAGQIPDASGALGLGAFSIAMLALHVYVVAVLIFFWRTRTSTA